MKHSFVAGLAAALLAAITWGLQFPVAKDVFAQVDSFHVTAVRYLGALSVLIPILLWREGRQAFSYQGLGFKVASLGGLGMSLSPFISFYGISLAGAERAAVVVALQPTLMAITQWALYKRRPSRFTLLCMAIAFSGVVTVVTRGEAAPAAARAGIIGSLMVLGGGGCWVYYTLGTERLTGWSVWRITVLTMIPGACCSIVVIAALIALGWLDPPGLANYQAVGWDLAFLSFFGVAIGMLAWNFGNRRIGPLNSMLLTNMMPVAAFSYRAWQGYEFSTRELVGAGLVIGALVANNIYLRRRFLKERRGTEN